jgi:acyl dehydratase
MRTFTSFDELSDAIGQELGTSDWLTIDQARVDQFADATGDHQWIHVDVERAASGPFGGTIAHGYLTLSLVPFLGAQVFALDTPGAKLNYGVNKVRFPAPLLVGSRVRDTVTVKDVTDLPSGKQLVLSHVITVETPDGQLQERPACVAETVVLLLP